MYRATTRRSSSRLNSWSRWPFFKNPHFYVTSTSGILDMLAQPIGRTFNTVRDALTRGWRENLHFIDYEDLTANPAEVMARAYRFLGEEPFQHDFDHVEQLTFEDDYAYGFKDLHKIRAKVEPQGPSWPTTFDDSVYGSQAWKNVERFARTWPREK